MKLLIMLLMPLNLWAVGNSFIGFDGDLLVGQTIASTPMKVLNFDNVSFHTVYDTVATSAGTCSMQVSNDNVNYVTVANSTHLLTDVSGNDYVNKANIAAVWMRATCTNSGAVDITNLKITLGGK